MGTLGGEAFPAGSVLERSGAPFGSQNVSGIDFPAFGIDFPVFGMDFQAFLTVLLRIFLAAISFFCFAFFLVFFICTCEQPMYPSRPGVMRASRFNNTNITIENESQTEEQTRGTDKNSKRPKILKKGERDPEGSITIQKNPNPSIKPRKHTKENCKGTSQSQNDPTHHKTNPNAMSYTGQTAYAQLVAEHWMCLYKYNQSRRNEFKHKDLQN